MRLQTEQSLNGKRLKKRAGEQEPMTGDVKFLECPAGGLHHATSAIDVVGKVRPLLYGHHKCLNRFNVIIGPQPFAISRR